jgi:hypothetical protein
MNSQSKADQRTIKTLITSGKQAGGALTEVLSQVPAITEAVVQLHQLDLVCLAESQLIGTSRVKVICHSKSAFPQVSGVIRRTNSD